MECHGFKLVGLGESSNQVEDKTLPEEWNKNIDAYSFRYRHSQSSMTFLLKALRLGTKLLVHALALEQNEILQMDLDTADYVNNVQSFDNIDSVFRDTDKLLKIFTDTIVLKLIPTVSSLQSSAPNRNAPAPQRQPRVDPYPDPYPDDPLRIGPPRRPQGHVDQRNPYSIGDDDLFPGPGSGFGMIGPPPGYGGPLGGGGNVVGPNHPIFGQGRGGNPFGFNPPDAFGPQGVRPPPGARFDPLGPPGVNQPGPDYDHMHRPGRRFDDTMFG